MAKDEFDESKYRVIEEVGEYQPKEKKAKIVCVIFQYGENPPKAKVQRAGTKGDGTTYKSEIGGVNADEAEAVGKLLLAAAKALRKIS
jgi:hypothetical protein